MEGCQEGERSHSDDSDEVLQYTFAVIGGGIAGVSCVEQILEYDQEARILLISASPVVKEACQITRLSKTLEDFIIVEKSLKSFKDVHQSVRVVHGEVSQLLPEQHLVITKLGEKFSYKKICICTGASPRVLFPGWEHVVGIRDTESVSELSQKISKARKVLLLGNGGIATEFVHEVDGVDVVWAVKDKAICAHFVDPGAAEFFVQSKLIQPSEEGDSIGNTITLPSTSVNESTSLEPSSISNPLPPESATAEVGSKRTPPSKRRKYTLSSIPASSSTDNKPPGDSDNFGSALGPDWHQGLKLQGTHLRKNVQILCGTECTEVRKAKSEEEKDWPVFAQLNNGTEVGCDLIISATGVVPNYELFKDLLRSDTEKGIIVDDAMRTSVPDVYAAGDVCFPSWEWSKHWFQMRLWTQARHMGLYAGKSMFLSIQKEMNPDEDAEEIDLDFCFECFSHITRFFGFKVVLLGLYNGQGLEKSRQHLLVRCTKDLEYVKVVLEDWKMQGAILIGETGLEETFENLILNQVDLSTYGEDLLNPDIDIEDYFD